MIEDTTIQLIRDLGFPIVVVLWFMFRTEKILKENSKAINRLAEAMEKTAICPLSKRQIGKR